MTHPEPLCDLKITGGVVLTQNGRGDVFDPGCVYIRGDRIIGVHPLERDPDLPRLQEWDARGRLVMPGLVNTHTHLAMSCFRGLADDLPLMTWLHDYIFPVESKFVDDTLVYRGSLLSCVEVLLSGTTTVADGYFFEADAVRAMEASGLRAVACQGVVDFPAPGVPDPGRNVEAAVRFMETDVAKKGRIRRGVFCHSAYTCSPETLVRAKNACRERGAPLFIHLAETEDEIREIQKRYGCSPVKHLERLGLLDEDTVAVHCVWLSTEDIEILAKNRTSVSHNPESGMKLGSGAAPVEELLNRGVIVGLGTDGPASNNDQDLFLEMDTAAKLQKVRALDPTRLSARKALHAATLGGAQALGLGREIGSLEPGKKADVILLNLDRPHLTPVYDYHSLVVYAVKGSDVESVIVDGRVLVENRRILSVDPHEAMENVRKLAADIRKTLHRPLSSAGGA